MADRTRLDEWVRSHKSTWIVEVISSAAVDAHRVLSSRGARAHAVTTSCLRVLGGFPRNRPRSGRILDLDYDCVPGELIRRMRISDDAYGDDDLCVFFVPFPASPQDGCGDKSGKIVIFGFCWWGDRELDKFLDRARRRYRRYYSGTE
jgi:hypothetical protein